MGFRGQLRPKVKVVTTKQMKSNLFSFNIFNWISLSEGSLNYDLWKIQPLVFPQNFHTAIFFPLESSSLLILFLTPFQTQTHKMQWSHFSDIMLFYSAHSVNIFQNLCCFSFFFFPLKRFVMSAEGQMTGICLVFKDLLLCLREFPVFILFSRQLAESNFRPWSLWTGSVTLIAQVIDQKESTVIPPRRAEGQLPLAGGRWEAGFRLCTVCLSVFLFSLLSLGGSCCFIHPGPDKRPVLNCIDCAKSWMSHSRREKLFVTDDKVI